MSKNPYAITFGRIPNQYISRDILIDGMIIPYLISNNIASATANGQLVRFVVGGVQHNALMVTDSSTAN